MHQLSCTNGQVPSFCHTEQPFIEKIKVTLDDNQKCTTQEHQPTKNNKPTKASCDKSSTMKGQKLSKKERMLAKTLSGKKIPMAYNSLSDLLKDLDFSQPLTVLQFQSYMQLAVNVTYATDVKDHNSLISQWMNEHASQENSDKVLEQLLRSVKKNKSIKLNKETQHAYRMIEELYNCLKLNIERRKELKKDGRGMEYWEGGKVLMLDSTKTPVVDLKISKEIPIYDDYYNLKSIHFTQCSSDIGSRPMTDKENFLQILALMGAFAVAIGFALAHY